MAGHKSVWSHPPRKARPYKPLKQERNAAPSQWARRLARLVGEKFDVEMSLNHSKNNGVWRGQKIAIKCAKSTMPPISILLGTLESIDHLWAVYVMPEGHAEIWVVTVEDVRTHAYFTHGAKTQKRAEVTRRKILALGTRIGTITVQDVDSCRIP